MCRPYSPPSRLVGLTELCNVMIINILYINPSATQICRLICGFLSSLFSAVVAGRAKPQQPGQQSGCTALSGKQEGVREEGDGHRGAELGGRLSLSRSLLLPLHHPLFITPVLQSFIFTSSRKKKQQLYQKNSSATLKKGRIKKISRNNQTRMDINVLANTFEENEGGEINLIFVFLVLNFTFFYCMM